MKRQIVQFVGEEDGQDLIEYALLAGLIAVTVITAALELSRIREFFAAAGAALDDAI